MKGLNNLPFCLEKQNRNFAELRPIQQFYFIYGLFVCLSFLLQLHCFGQRVNHQQVEFQPFKFKAFSGDSVSMEMGKITVPENRRKSNTNSIQLAFVRLKAKTPTHLSPVMFLAGGPGQSGINYIKEEYFQKLIFQLQQDHDIILLDQRGVGRSTPSLVYKIPQLNTKDLFLTKEAMINYANMVSKAGADSLKSKLIDITGYNTVENADDLNDLRIALGAEKINLLAISYGTHLALAAAKKYPDFIDHMVLIGTSGLNHMHHLPSTYDKQLRQISDLATQDPAINQEVPDMIKLLKRVLDKLDKEPIRVQIKEYKTNQLVEIPVGKFGLQMILRLDVGDGNDFICFPALLYGIDKGDYKLLQTYLEKRYNQFSGNYGSGIGVMRIASGASKERYAQITREGKSALLGNAMNTPDIYGKNYWGDIDLGDDFRKSFKSNIRTMFISGTMDSNTPPSNAEEVKKDFTQSTHLLVEYAGHEDMLPNERVQQNIIGFYKGESINSAIALPKPKFVEIIKQ